MSSKKKLVISLSVAAAVLVAAIIAIVAVFAASTQAVKSNVKIKYTTTNVSGTVDAWYTVKNEDQESIGKSTFTATTPANDIKLENKVIELTDDNDSVTFRFVFTNNGGNTMYINLTGVTAHHNIGIQYKVGSNAVDTTLAEQSIAGRATAEAAAQTCEISVIFSIKDKAFNIEEQEFDIQWSITSTSLGTVYPAPPVEPAE